MASFTVYLTINLINNKVYIGQTSINNSSYIGSGKIFKKAIKKYGKSVFKRCDLIKCNTIEETNQWEKFYITLFDSKNPEVGYNIKEGGLNASFEHTTEAISKIKTRSNQEDNKIRIREIQKLAVIKRRGTFHSKETKLKIINSKYGKLRKIIAYDSEMDIVNIFDTSIEASVSTGVSQSAIRNNLCGLSKSTRNFIFKYQ